WATLKSEIDARQKLLVRQAEIPALAESVRNCLQREDVRRAAAELAAARAKYSGEGLWATLQAEIDERQELLRQRTEVLQLEESIRGCMKRDHLRQAAGELDAARAKYPSEGRWVTLAADISARQVWLSRQAEVAAIAESIRGCLKRDDLRQAVAELGAARAKYPDESLWAALEVEISARQVWLNRQAEVAAIGENIRGCLKRDDLRQAVAELSAARTKYPSEGLWVELQGEADARQALLNRQAEVAAIGESIRGCLKRDDLRQAVAELGAARAKYPGESLWATLEEIIARQTLLKRQAEIAAIVESIRRCLKRENVRQAVADLGAARAKYPGESLWAELQVEVDARQALLKRQAEIAAMAESIRGCLKRDDLRQAAAELGAARTKYPGENLWATLEAEISARQALLKRQTEIAAMAESIRGCLKRDDLRQAAAELGTARTKYPGENLWATLEVEIGARQALLKRQAEIAAVAESIRGSLKRDDLRQAAAELGTARTRYPGENLLATLEAEINARQSALETIEQERRRREQDLHEAQRNAEALLAQGRPEEAIALLEGRFGGEPVVRELIARARGDLDRRRRENDRARLLAIEQQVESAPPKRKVRELDAEAQGIAARRPRDEEFAQIASRIHARAVSVLEAPAAKKPIPWKLVGIGAAVAALVAALVLVPKLFHKKVPAESRNMKTAVSVEIRTDPLGASVRVGDRSCVTPNCRIDLAPGQYQVQAELKGFEPARKTVTVDASGSPNGVDLTLAPVLPPPPASGATGKLAVLAGQAGVLVVVDGTARERTGADGRLNLLLEAKTHDVRVEKDRYQPASRQVQIVPDGSQQVEFTLLPKEAKIELLGAPAGVELRLGNRLLGRTDGSADFAFPRTVAPGRQTLLVTGGGASRPYLHEFQPDETLKLPWKDVAPGVTPHSPTEEEKEARDWDQVRNSTDLATLRAFVAAHPKGAHRPDAEIRIEDLAWARVNKESVDALQAFLKDFGAGSPHAAEVSFRLADLAWKNVDQSKEDSLRKFVEEHPGNPHVPDARKLLDAFERQRQQAEAEHLKQLDAKKQADAQKQQIRAALERFNEAFRRNQKSELQAVWPGNTNKQFVDALGKSVIELRPIGEPVNLTRSQAAILCTEVISARQPRQTNEVPLRVFLENRGGTWIITGVGPPTP
ncbi:MAG: PEGA domain-containing protein, partial [Acidobacteriia bacterium]|nr:PEGA domain-containing protein [Terriglobia bacterium]